MHRIFDQKGYILPLTFIVCLLIPLIIIAEVELYKIEQRFVMEEEELEKSQRLTHNGFKDIVKQIHVEEGEEDEGEDEEMTDIISGVLSYPTGTVQYSIEPLGDNRMEISGTSITDVNRMQYFIITINQETKEIEKWVEE